MKRFYLLSLLACGLLGARACVDAPIKVDAPVKVEAEASVAKTEAPLSDESMTTTDIQTVVWELKELSNTVHNTKSIIHNVGDPKSLILLMMLMQGVQMLRDFVKDFLGKRKA